MFAWGIFLAGCLLFGMEKQGFSEPCAPLKAFSNVLEFDRTANGQMVSQHDCDRDGLADYRSFWTVVEFAGNPVACQDPYDPRQLIVPRTGYYRVLAEPEHVEVLLKKKTATVGPLGVSSFSGRDLP